MTFKICVPFWLDIADSENSTRLRNVRFGDFELKKMTSYLREKGIDISYEIFDFSPSPVFGTHIPGFGLGEFRKSEKWNQIIDRTFSDIFIGIDSDMFIHEVDYEAFAETLLKCTSNDIFLHNCKCIWDADLGKIDWDGHDTSCLVGLNMHHYQSIGNTCSFGGLWVCPTKFLKDIGGFNENLKYRGHEDGEILTRILREFRGVAILNKISTYVPIHLPHIYHFADSRYHNPENNKLNGGDWQPRTVWS